MIKQMDKTPEITVKISSKEFVDAIEKYREELEQIHDRLHTLGNAINSKLNITEAEIVARQVATDTVIKKLVEVGLITDREQ